MLIGRENQIESITRQIEEMIAGRRERNVLFVTGEAVSVRLMGRKEEAIDCFRRSLEIHRRRGSSSGEAALLNNLGIITLNSGESEEAQRYFSRSMEICRRLGDSWTESYCTNNLGVIAQTREDYPEALGQFEHA